MVDTIVNVEKTVCRKEYFRQYYQQNKDKYIKENTRNDIVNEPDRTENGVFIFFGLPRLRFSISFN